MEKLTKMGLLMREYLSRHSKCANIKSVEKYSKLTDEELISQYEKLRKS